MPCVATAHRVEQSVCHVCDKSLEVTRSTRS